MGLDGVAKRQLVLAVALVAQSLKIYELVVEGRSAISHAFFLKWLLIETALVLALWRAQVPRLQFGLAAALGLSALLCFLNVTVLLLLPLLIDHLRLRLMPLSATVELMGIEDESVSNIFGSKERLLQDFRNDTHLQGAYTVKIRPVATALLNPDGIPLCLLASTPMPNSHQLPEMLKRPLRQTSDRPQGELPVQLEGTGPWRVILYRDGASFREYSVETHHCRPEANGKFRTALSVDAPGNYTLYQVLDGDGTAARIDEHRPTTVTWCPELRIDGLAIKHGIRMCNRPTDSFPLKLWIAGEHLPLIATFELIHDGQREEKTLVLEEGSLGEGQKSSSRVFRPFLYSLAGLSQQAQLLVRIISIQDASGLRHTYGTWDEGDSVMVEMLAPPTVAWGVVSPAHPKVKLLDTMSRPVVLPIKLSGHGPFKFAVKIPDGSTQELGASEDNPRVEFKLSQPGTYSLLSPHDSLCVGNVNAPRDLIVEQVARPTIHLVGRESLASTCRGYAGLRLDLELTGEGPWLVDAVESFISAETRRRESRSLRLSLDTSPREFFWRPENSGENTLELQYLSDANYAKIPIKGIKVAQVVSQGPAAIITDVPSPLISCLSDPASKLGPVRVALKGSAPWLLEYSLMFPGGLEKKFSLESTDSAADLCIHHLVEAAGHYKLVLDGVRDSQGCRVELQQQRDSLLDIYLFSESPTVLFEPPNKPAQGDEAAGHGVFRVREGLLDLVPLTVRANIWPLTVELTYTPSDGPRGGQKGTEIRKVTIPDPTVKGVLLEKAGWWTITSVSDGHCHTDQQSIRQSRGGVAKALVQLVPSPSIVFTKDNAGLVCARPDQREIEAKVECRGELPMSVEYQVKYAASSNADFPLAPLLRKRVTFDSRTGVLRMDSNGVMAAATPLQPGYYKFEILTISDTLYTSPLPSAAHLIQQLLPRPVPSLTHSPTANADYFCVGTDRQAHDRSLGPFVLSFAGSDLVGNALESIKYELLAGDGHHLLLSSKEITANPAASQGGGAGPGQRPFEFTIDEIKSAGVYFLRIAKVATRLGCTWERESDETPAAAVARRTATKLQVHEKPRVRLRPGLIDDLCVGDVAHFEVVGEGPVRLESSFEDRLGNSRQKHDTVSSGSLNVLLAEAGQLRIASVCSRHCCATMPSGGQAYQVYPLPSASITDGTNYLHEGEEASFEVSLHGTPPFAFEYQRLDPESGKLLETLSVTSVLEHRTRVPVKSEGTFKISSVSDRHCRYPKRKAASP